MVLFLFPWEPAKVVQVADIPMVVVVVALGGSVKTSGSSVKAVILSQSFTDEIDTAENYKEYLETAWEI